MQPFEETPIVAKLAGYIESITVEFGDRVRKDQPLIHLRAPEYKDQIIQKQGLVSQAGAELARAQTKLQHPELKAPFDGVVTSRSVDIGRFAQPAGGNSSTPLMTIANVDKVLVFVSVPESEAGWIDARYSDSQQGDSVRLSSPFLSQPIDTGVTRTSSQLDYQSRKFSVEIDVDNREYPFLLGAFITAKILLEQRENTLVLPISAVIRATDKTYCCDVENGKIQHRPIELGLRVGDEVEIAHGITAEETIVLLRGSALLPGQVVETIDKK